MSVITLARVAAVVGLDLSLRTYPGGRPLRDAAHARLLAKLHAVVHDSLTWSVEVPFPNAGDQRAWDAMIRGAGWRYGVEAETNPLDGQAILRRLALKRRDGGVDGMVLLLPDTRQSRHFRREFERLLNDDFPVRSSAALRSLRRGESPGGNAVVVAT